MITTRYYSYLMRIWQDDDLLNGGWQASLEDPTTQQLTYFKSLEELFLYLRRYSGTCEKDLTPHDQAEQGQGNQLIYRKETPTIKQGD